MADTDVDTASVVSMPRNEALQQLPKGLIAQKAASAGGVKPMWKPVDHTWSVPMLACSADKQEPLELDGKAISYTIRAQVSRWQPLSWLEAKHQHQLSRHQCSKDIQQTSQDALTLPTFA